MSTKTKAKGRKTHDLSALIPAKWNADEYINRKIGGKRDVEILAHARASKMNTLIFGPTGPGKTSCVLAYAAEFDIPFYSVPCNGAIDPRQLFGSWVPTEIAGIYVWQDGPVTTLVRKGGVLYLDEVNFMPPRIASTLHSLADKRRTLSLLEHGNEVIVAHDEFQIVGSYNPDYEGTRPLNEAFRNRFAIKLFFDYDEKIEKELVSSDALLNLAAVLRDSHRVGDIDTPISTNMLMEFEDIAYDIGFDFAVENILNAFTSDERSAVKEVMNLHNSALAADFNGKDDDDDEAASSVTDEVDGLPTDGELKRMNMQELKDVAYDYDLDISGGPHNKGSLLNRVLDGINELRKEFGS